MVPTDTAKPVVVKVQAVPADLKERKNEVEVGGEESEVPRNEKKIIQRIKALLAKRESARTLGSLKLFVATRDVCSDWRCL